MCYTKKIVDNAGRDLGSKFEGNFNCKNFNCNGCNEGFVDGERPKRNLN